MRWINPVLFAIAALIIAGILWGPSRWLARRHALTAYGPDRAMLRLLETDLTNTAPAAGGDSALEVASAALDSAPWVKDRARRTTLRTLAERRPDDPLIRAALIRQLSMEAGRLDFRPEEQRNRTTPLAPGAPAPKRSDPEIVGAFLADAAAGERAEPDNAFFPAMAAVGFYTLNDDTKAHAALHRAALAPRWDDHMTQLTAAEIRLIERYAGRQTALGDATRSMIAFFPHYSRLRSLARITIEQAADREKAGDIAGGLALRRDVRALGLHLSDHSRDLIGSLVGVAILRIAINHPAGAKYTALATPQNEPPDGEDSAAAIENERRRTALWSAYAARIHQPEIADWADDAVRRRQYLKRIDAQGEPRSVAGAPGMMRQFAAFLASTSALCALMGMALLVGYGVLLSRTASARAGERQGAAVRWGMIAPFCALPFVGAALFLNRLQISGGWIGYVLASVAVGLCVWQGARSGGARAALATLGNALALSAMLVLPAYGTIRASLASLQMVQLFSDLQEFPDAQASGGISSGASPFAGIGQLANFMPVALLLIALIVALVRREPLLNGIPRVLSRAAAAGLLISTLLYTLALTIDSRIEDDARAAVRVRLDNEPRYLANLAGEPWPYNPHAAPSAGQ